MKKKKKRQVNYSDPASTHLGDLYEECGYKLGQYVRETIQSLMLNAENHATRTLNVKKGLYELLLHAHELPDMEYPDAIVIKYYVHGDEVTIRSIEEVKELH